MTPLPQLHAAWVAGQLVAQGLLAETEILPPIIAEAATGAPARAAILSRFTAARDAMAAERRRTAWRIRAALAPLVEARAAGSALLAAAAGADRAQALLARERRQIAEQLIRRALARQRTG
jgi:hypothetical protein